ITESREDIAHIFRDYDLYYLPIVDEEKHLLGIVTSDQIIDVIDEESTEDIQLMGGLVPFETEYLETGAFRLFLNRLPWLLFLMISSTITGMVIEAFEDMFWTLGNVGIMIIGSLPMLMDTGGNCGSQTSTLIIRGIALGHISFKDLVAVIYKELRVSFLVGLTLCAANIVRQLALYYLVGEFSFISFKVTMVVSCAVFLTVVLSKVIGCLLPLIAHRLNKDPALMSAPLITTIVDTLSVAILLALSYVVLV
ncbi:MAG: magnesium transporter, partial [Sphaerochaetaceae bacterium]|nr:magnesium transporter [Sphaerochaetaceae bacterium]